MKFASRILIALCSILLLIAVVAMGDACDHYQLDDPDNDYTYKLVATTSTTHTYEKRVTRTCVYCGQAGPDVVNTKTENHNMSLRLWDAGHEPNGTHAYMYRCSICAYEKKLWFSCSGPPCPVTPINKKPLEEPVTE